MIISTLTPKEDLESSATCNQCGHCCFFSSGIVLDEEIPGLAQHFGMSEDEFKAKYLEEFTKLNTTKHRFKQLRIGNAPHGRCIFLDVDSKKCTIQDVKPLHCRVSTCQPHGEDVQKWFDYHHFLKLDDRASVREYAIYCDLKGALPGAELGKLLSKERIKNIIGGD